MRLEGQQVVDHINQQLLKLSRTHPGKNVCIDFDSVLAHHEEGDPLHAIGEALEPGINIVKTVRKLGLNPIILTARPQQFHQKMAAFLASQGAQAPVTNVKPPALMYIDDKAERYPANFGARVESFESEAMEENGGDACLDLMDGGKYMSLATHESQFMEHGVLGMKWGVHKPKDISDWKKIGGQKGSNPGGTYEDLQGFAYYVKFYKNPEQGRSEILANSIYAELGIPAAYSKPVELAGKEGVAAAWINGKSTTPEEQKQDVDVKRGFVADAYLANHDVIGLEHENIVKDTGENFFRIDNGGSMFFRARGGPKDFVKDSVPELQTMRFSPMAKQAGPIFNQLTDGQLKPQAEELVDRLGNKKIQELVAQAGFRGAEADKYEKALMGRRDAIAAYFGIGKAAKQDVLAQAGDDDSKGKGKLYEKGKSLKQTFLDKTPKESRAGGYFLHDSLIGKLYDNLAKAEGDWHKISNLQEQHGGTSSVKNRLGTLKSIGNWVGKWSVEVSGDSVRMFVNKGEQVVKHDVGKSEEQETHEQQLANSLAKEYIQAEKTTTKFGSDGKPFVPSHISVPMFEKYYQDMGVSQNSVSKMEGAVKSWTGSVNLETAQSMRQVAMQYYGRQAKDEYTGSYSKIIGKDWGNSQAAAMKDGVMAMKAYASEYAKEKGINVVYRGFKEEAVAKMYLKDELATGSVSLPFNSLSSWSESKATARAFAAKGGVVVAMKVDPDNIWAVHSATPWLFSLHKSEEEIIVGTKQPVQKFKKEDLTFV